MDTPFRILSICDDDGLRYSRELLLVKGGFVAESVTSDSFLSMTKVRSFDAALICQSVPPHRVVELDETLRRYNPEIQVLSMAALESAEACDPEPRLLRRPARLLQAVRLLRDQHEAIRSPFDVAHRA